MIGGVAPAPHPSYSTTRQESQHAKTHKNYTPVEQTADGGHWRRTGRRREWPPWRRLHFSQAIARRCCR